jgi:serine/threonine protein kinase
MQSEFPSAAVQDAVHTVRGVATTLCARIAEILDAQERYGLLLKEVKGAQAQGPPKTTTIDALNATVKKLRRRIGYAKVDLENEDDPAEQEILIQELAESKKELQSTLGSLRREISRVVILAQGHFPEVLRRSTELAQFGRAMVGTELFADRPLEEYSQVEILARKPHMVRLMSFDGELCVLKEFSVHALKTFVSEANRMRRLRHPHVASVGVCFACKDHVYMEMPYYAGGSLPAWLKRLSNGGVEVSGVAGNDAVA